MDEKSVVARRGEEDLKIIYHTEQEYLQMFLETIHDGRRGEVKILLEFLAVLVSQH
jgi:hypothetical protein